MLGKIFEEVFGTPTFGELLNDYYDELMEKFDGDEEKDDEKTETHSYFHSIKDKYEDGEHVSHKEKEIKDGKVIKDEQFDYTHSLEDGKGCCKEEKECCKENCDEKKPTSHGKYYKELSEHYKGRAKDLEKENQELKEKLAEVEAQKNFLLGKFEQVKEVFKVD